MSEKCEHGTSLLRNCDECEDNAERAHDARLEARKQARERQREAFLNEQCVRCGVRLNADPEVICDYMATNESWLAAGFKPTDVACLCCFEARLGRDLREDDLKAVIINRLLRYCLRAGFRPWRIA